MDYFGLNSADQLPKIDDILASQIVEPTLVQAEHFEIEKGENLAVSEEGRLVEKPGEEGSDATQEPPQESGA